MTLPHERHRAILNAREFLLSLLDPKRTPRVPREIRLRARSALKHYPHNHELQTLRNHPLFKDEYSQP